MSENKLCERRKSQIVKHEGNLKVEKGTMESSRKELATHGEGAQIVQ